MNARIIGFTLTSSSIVNAELNSDLHFAKERIREYAALGNPRSFITSPTEIRRTNYKKAAGLLRNWLTEALDTDSKNYDELEASLSQDKVKIRED